MKRVIKTPGQRYFEETYPHFRWDGLSSSKRETYEVKANRLGIQPIEEDVPMTDGELMQQAYETTPDGDAFWNKLAAEFIRLRVDRDGEPLDVHWYTVARWETEYVGDSSNKSWSEFLAAKINAHRGVRSLPKVTAELCRNAHLCGTFAEMADYINVELAKAAKDGE